MLFCSAERSRACEEKRIFIFQEFWLGVSFIGLVANVLGEKYHRLAVEKDWETKASYTVSYWSLEAAKLL